MLPVAILAGGLATRLRPITTTVPKSLLEVAGKPFIRHQLEYLKKQGITRVVLCVGHLGEMIEADVGDGSSFGLEVRYLRDGDKLLGTGGAVRQALPLLGTCFFVLYGDSFLPIDFKAVEEDFYNSGKPAIMTVMKNGNRWDTSNVLYRDHQLIEYNKFNTRPEMQYIDYGLGILCREVFEGCTDKESFDLAEIYHQLSLKGKLAGHEVNQRFYEIGSFEGLKATEKFLTNM
jgi:NDP-sugar pyrophosphorylase family protein